MKFMDLLKLRISVVNMSSNLDRVCRETEFVRICDLSVQRFGRFEMNENITAIVPTTFIIIRGLWRTSYWSVLDDFTSW